MKLKKILCLAAAFTFGACAFAGCGNTDNNTPDTGDNGEQGGGEVKEVASYLRTDKQIYCADEDVYLTAGGGEESWVGIFHDGSTLTQGNAVIRYSVNKDGM